MYILLEIFVFPQVAVKFPRFFKRVISEIGVKSGNFRGNLGENMFFCVNYRENRNFGLEDGFLGEYLGKFSPKSRVAFGVREFSLVNFPHFLNLTHTTIVCIGVVQI